jgi:ADP-ribose pyrophosphatase
MYCDYFDLIKKYPYFFDNTDALFRIIQDKDVIKRWQGEMRKKLLADRKPLSWADIGVLLDDKYILVIRDLVEFHDGAVGGYIRIVNQAELAGGEGVAILPVLDDKIILLNQYRHATRAWHMEIPRGFGEPYVSSTDNAYKEIEEEINGKIAELSPLGCLHSNTGLETQRVNLFFARLDSVGLANVTEGIREIRTVPLDEFETMIADALVTDGFTIAAYTRAKLKNLLKATLG